MKVGTEQRLSAVLCAAMVAYGMSRAEQVKKKRQKVIEEEREKQAKSGKRDPYYVQKVPSASDRIVDHPVVPWLLHNSSTIGIAIFTKKIMERLLGKADQPSFLRSYFTAIIVGNLSNEMHMTWNWFLINKIYGHIPAFSNKVKKPSSWEVFKDYLQCNFITIFITSIPTAFMSVHIENLRKEDPTIGTGAFRPLRFVAKLMVCRVITDFFFWSGHYVLHTKKFYWLHKKHHEHNNTRLETNYHFSVPDLLIEAFIPFLCAMTVIESFSSKPTSKMELQLLAGYIFSFEIESHAGKALPTMTLFPPISLLMTEYDDWNAWFHETHHNRLKCNYSISPFWDLVFGTSRFE